MTPQPKTYHYTRNDICRNCHGSKTIFTQIRIGNGHYEEPEIKTCPVCQGEGMVTVTKDITVTITPLKRARNFPVNNYK